MDQTQFFYITSMSWKAHDQKYHGYIDDVIFVLFGIEDASAGGIDVVAGDLLKAYVSVERSTAYADLLDII